MNWFRWWVGSVTDPKFGWIARRSKQPVASVLATWACLLECASDATKCNADATRGNVTSFDCADWDVALGLDDGAVQSICAAMVEKGLIADGCLTGWERRQPKREDSGNPNTGALSSTERSRLHRERKKRDATDATGMQRDATHCDAPEEIRGEEKREKLNPTNPTGLVVASEADDQSQDRQTTKKPDCPHQEIIALYHDLLPTSPAIRDWTPTRAAHLRARWNEDAKRQNLDWWRRFFAYVAECGFLTGKVTSNGRKPFVASLEWLVKPDNFAKVREGRYHDAEAA
ncbi:MULTISPECIES: hypothetical protein [Burkholderia]|uniref:hypothetical protein n=1 Tax=Burkholderia TaxID=32008 RepID=UPI00158F01F9|nr:MULTISPECIES: hypothetical protein [Burkholderia]